MEPAAQSTRPSRRVAEKVVHGVGLQVAEARYSLDVTPYYSMLTAPGFNVLNGVQTSTTGSNLYVAQTPPNQTSDYGVEVDADIIRLRLRSAAALTWQDSKEIHLYLDTPNGPGPLPTPCWST